MVYAILLYVRIKSFTVMSITFVTTSAHSGHTNARHPERAERIAAILTAIQHDEELSATFHSATAASTSQVHRIHEPAYVQSLQRLCASLSANHSLYADTYTTAHTYTAALMSAGAACTAADLMVQGHTAFALTRPPGHHAEAAESMGFCFFNNVAIAARHLQDQYGLQRIAIVDIDVHHGNGTQSAFYADADVLFVSSHASPLYPFTGAANEVGSDAGYGTTLNIPVPAHTGDPAFARVYREVVIPALARFAPDCILVSAGFDAHWDDPIGNCRLSVAGYAHIMQQLCEAARTLCHGRIAAILEGGYSERALAACVQAAARVMQGLPVSDGLGIQPSDPHRADQVIATLKAQHPLLNTQRSLA